MNNILLLFAQSQTAVVDSVPTEIQESYFDLVLKGGWIMLPLFLLLLLTIYIIVYKIISLSSLGKLNERLLSKVLEFVHEKKIDKALFIVTESKSAESSVILTGLKEIENGVDEVENQMELEARIQISRLESGLNLLAITSSVAPMLGFLGTIFGVIRIFYSIAQTNDISISIISEGLYEKMICSGAGLLVGIIAFVGFSLLNNKVDRTVLGIDYSSNQVLKAIRKTVKDENTTSKK